MSNRFTKYYTKTGEIVLVEQSPDNTDDIFVYYRNNRYIRKRTIIGQTLFPFAPQNTHNNKSIRASIPDPTVKCNSHKQIRSNVSKQTQSTVKKAPIEATVAVNTIVTLKDYNTQEHLTVYLCDTEIQYRIKRMGGAYYGNQTEAYETSDAGNEWKDGITKISTSCPLGKAILGKAKGSRIFYRTPDLTPMCYTIISIERP